MNAIPCTVARENLASTMDRVCEAHDPVIITRDRDRAVAMLFSATTSRPVEYVH